MTDHENYCPKCGTEGKMVKVIKEEFGYPCCNTYDEPGTLRYCLIWNAETCYYEASLLTPDISGAFRQILAGDYITASTCAEGIIKDLGLFPVHLKKYDILKLGQNKRTIS